MKKMPTLFVREFPDKQTVILTTQVHPDCEWVIAGEGRATQKVDGTCCLLSGGKLFKRYDAKHGKTPPVDFVPAQPEADPVTGHWPGWVPVVAQDKWHVEAWERITPAFLDGTYELIGPKINGNPEGWHRHELWSHDYMPTIPDCPITLNGLRELLAPWDVEGIVWHHPDGRRAKIRKSDFGMPRKPR